MLINTKKHNEIPKILPGCCNRFCYDAFHGKQVQEHWDDGNSSTVGILIYLNPLIAFALAILFYKEDITFEQIMAYSLILVSIVVFNIGSYLKMKRME